MKTGITCVLLPFLSFYLASSSSTCYPPVKDNFDRSCEYCPLAQNFERSIDLKFETHVSFFLYEGSIHEYAEIFWVDYVGQEKSVGVVPRGARRERKTIEGNVFRVWDPKHETLLLEHRVGSYPVRYENLVCDAQPGPPNRRLSAPEPPVEREVAQENPAMEHYFPMSFVNRGGCSAVGLSWRNLQPRVEDSMVEVYKLPLEYGQPVRMLVEQNNKFVARIGGKKVWEQVIEDIEIPDCIDPRVRETQPNHELIEAMNIHSKTMAPEAALQNDRAADQILLEDAFATASLDKYLATNPDNGTVFIQFHGNKYTMNEL